MKTKTLKLTGLLITMMILIATLGMFSITSSAADDLTVDITGADGSIKSVTLQDADGDGYYEIGTADELYAFASAVNGGNSIINGELTANITVNENVLDEDGALNGEGSNFRKWTPIGNDSNEYSGIFDGAEHTVSGLYVNNTEQNYVGLFGKIDNGVTVKNVGVVDSYFNAKDFVGGVVGYNTDGTVANCYNTGTVNGEDYVGGVVGCVWGDDIGMITNCYNTGTVTGAESVGGVAGGNYYGTITNCYNTGTVNGEYYVGGVAGENYYDSTITNCYNTGSVNGGNYVGGVVGYNYINSPIMNCYYLAGSAATGIGAGESADITEVTEAQVEAESGEEDALVDMLNEWVSEQTDAEYAGWHLCSNGTSHYPSLKLACTYSDNGENHVVECTLCGDETEEAHIGGEATCRGQECDKCGAWYGEIDHEKDTFTNGFRDCCGEYEPATQNAEGVYEIESAGQLYWFAAEVGSGNTSINGKLTANITVNENVLDEDGELNGDGSDFRVWTPIGNNSNKYSGIFDGAEHTVSGLYFNNTKQDFVGLFSNISGATVKNVGVVDSYFDAKDYVGAVAGENYNDSTIMNCYNTGAVNGESGVGGVVGDNYYDSTIMNCYNTGTVSGTVYYVGGVVGHSNRGTITNCYNAGTVSGAEQVGGIAGGASNSTITNCYNAGTVSGAEQVSGVVGENINSTITNCYYLEGAATGGINGADEDGKAVAKTAAQFASGEIAYLLQADQTEQVWGQTLAGEDKDAYPVLGGAAVYYGYISCAADAVMVYTNDETASDERLDHDMAEATCTLPSICKREDCGHTEGTVNENAHAWNEGAVTTDPTCSAVGKKTFTCTRNSAHTYTEDVAIDENAHAWNEGVVTTNPTCTEKGVKTYTCTHNSAHTYTEDVAIDENAHAWNEGAVTTNPTCTEKGVKTFTCTHNSAHTCTEDVDALGHKYDNACDATCNACGEERTPAEHVDSDENNACDECGAELPKDGLSGGAIAGIATGSAAVLGGGGFALFWFVIRKKRKI